MNDASEQPRRSPRLQPRTVVLACAAVGAVATLLVSVLPWVDFAYRSAEGHAAIETAATMIALLVAGLFAGRFSRSGRLDELLLTAGLLLLAAANVVFSLLPSLIVSHPGKFELWAPGTARLAGGLLLLASAWAPPRPISDRRRALAITTLAAAASLVVIAAAVALADRWLPRGLDPAVSPEDSEWPRLVGPAALLELQMVMTLVYAAAVYGFTRRAAAVSDEFMSWIAGGIALAAFARLNYFLFPSLYSDWVYTGDFLRLASWLVLLVGAGREIASYQRGQVEVAVLEERQRLARDLHDGMAQELAFISGQVRRTPIPPDMKEAPAEEIVAAVRAVAEGRSALSPEVTRTLLDEVRNRRNQGGSSAEAPLSRRELEVLRMIADGRENAEIAGELHLSPATVKGHVASILEKLGARNRLQAAVHAVRNGLV